MTRYTRQEWGAARANGNAGALVPDQVEGIALHWPGMATRRRGFDQVAQSLRAWQRFHIATQGWSDIAYQEAVDQDGNVYVLRGFGTRSGANGNTDLNGRFGALLLVLGPAEEPTAAMVQAVHRRVEAFRDKYPGARRIVGHGSIRPGGTECPGRAANRLIANGAFAPPRVVSNHVTRARTYLGDVLDLLTDAAAQLDQVPADRREARLGASQARTIRADVSQLLERLPRT